MGPFLDKNRAVVTTVHPIFGCYYILITIMTVGGSGGMLSQEIRYSEIASGAIFGQKQSRSNYSSSNIWLSYMHLLSQLTSNFNEKRY